MLEQETQYEYEVIVVDNSSDEIDFLKDSTEYKKVTWLSTTADNPYVSRNLGITKAKGRIIALLDAKCRPCKDWVELGMTKILGNDQMTIAGHYRVIPDSDELKDLIYGLLYLNNRKNVKHDYGVTTGNLWSHKSAFEDVGLFEEEHISGNDIAWSLKAKSLGYDIEYLKELEVKYPGQSYSQLCQSISKYMSGIAYQHKKSKSLGYRMTFFFKSLFPLRMSTYKEMITYRSLDHLSTKDKCYLWLLAWHTKIRMAIAYLASSISQ